MKSKLLRVLLALVIAVGLWLYVITVEQPESEKTYYDIPVVLQNESILAERGMMIVSERPTVTLTLAGTRTNLNTLNESNINVICNVSSIVTAGTHELTYSVSFPGNIPSGSVTRQNSDPDMVTLKVENKITKQIPVELDYMGTAVPEGMIVDRENMILDYATIETSGPESVMDQITKAVIQVDLQGQTQTIVSDYTYTLCNEAGEPVDAKLVTTNVEKVNLTLHIYRVKEIPLTVDVIAGGGATEQSCVIDIYPKTIYISGIDSQLEKLDSLKIGEIDLGAIEAGESIPPIPIVLDDGVTNESGTYEAVVTVRFPNLKEGTFSATDIRFENIPEGLEPELVTQTLEVKLRGPVALMESITEENITVFVDLSEAKLGTDKYTARIVLDSQFASVGELNTYTVMVTLKEPEEDA